MTWIASFSTICNTRRTFIIYQGFTAIHLRKNYCLISWELFKNAINILKNAKFTLRRSRDRYTCGQSYPHRLLFMDLLQILSRRQWNGSQVNGRIRVALTPLTDTVLIEISFAVCLRWVVIAPPYPRFWIQINVFLIINYRYRSFFFFNLICICITFTF